MGLLKRKMAEIEKTKLEKTFDIVCLYCFRDFPHQKVMFRALEAIDADGYRAEPDRVLDDYRAFYGLDSAGDVSAVLDPNDFREVNKGYHRGVLLSLKDDYGNVTTKRVCPFCHNELHHNAGLTKRNIVSIAGAPRSGKSVFLTSLIHTLKTVTPRSLHVFCTPLNSETGRIFKLEYEDPLVEEGVLPEVGQIEPPLVFTLTFSDASQPDLSIVLLDTGDGDEGNPNIYASHIRNSSAIIFLADPTQFREIGQKIYTRNALNAEPFYADAPTSILDRLLEGNIATGSQGASDIPAAVVLTKTDLLDVFRFDSEYVAPNSRFFTDYTQKDFFNLSEFYNIDVESEDFMADTDPNFRNAVKRRFKHVGFFAVSALGYRPEGGRVTTFDPVRIEEPLFWILYQLGYIEGFEVNEYEIREYATREHETNVPEESKIDDSVYDEDELDEGEYEGEDE